MMVNQYMFFFFLMVFLMIRHLRTTNSSSFEEEASFAAKGTPSSWGTPNFTLGFSHLLNLVNGDLVNGNWVLN